MIGDRKFENILDSFKEYNLGDVKNKFKNMEFNGEYYYLWYINTHCYKKIK